MQLRLSLNTQSASSCRPSLPLLSSKLYTPNPKSDAVRSAAPELPRQESTESNDDDGELTAADRTASDFGLGV